MAVNFNQNSVWNLKLIKVDIGKIGRMISEYILK